MYAQIAHSGNVFLYYRSIANPTRVRQKYYVSLNYIFHKPINSLRRIQCELVKSITQYLKI
jgi:hypothetical protein